jgi:hypothetical protein
LDFLLWGYVKDKVFRPKVCSAVELHARIKTAVASMTLEMLENIGREKYRFDIL